ncbi:hypothetical protein PSHT_04737 [Puccinia striiformis]|uniref:UDP-N-acetylglucosamine diphosphorylase n=1 Tax=Puccinia striiformis TaxID=27350 RepID=A0A2S4WC97_9BASI|nr:hypothetical protein PSHT_04737 [Puccinia striiformis]
MKRFDFGFFGNPVLCVLEPVHDHPLENLDVRVDRSVPARLSDGLLALAAKIIKQGVKSELDRSTLLGNRLLLLLIDGFRVAELGLAEDGKFRLHFVGFAAASQPIFSQSIEENSGVHSRSSSSNWLTNGLTSFDLQYLSQQLLDYKPNYHYNYKERTKRRRKKELTHQLSSIDPNRVNQIFKQSTIKPEEEEDKVVLEPPPKESLESIIDVTQPEIKDKISKWESIGFQSIKDQKIAILLLAGGQGTRLGSSDPKGCYDIGLPSQKSLFQIQAEKIIRLQDLVGGTAIIPWYIMTSGPTRKPTQDYFIKMNYFGLKKENVIFFEQGVLPALTPEGKMFLETRSRRHEFAGRSVLEDLKARGIEYIHAYCVDNCLVKVADPIFMGYCIDKQTLCGVKVVCKSQPTESVGVIARKNKLLVEMDESVASSIDSQSGQLKFNSANIANHFYSYKFLESIKSFEDKLSYHIANKKIPHIDLTTKELVKPKSLTLLEVDRKEEFSPLKNAPNTGTDDPQTSRRDLLAQQKRWLESAGCKFSNPNIELELSPIVSYAGEGLEILNGKTIDKSAYVHDKDGLNKL